MKKIFLIISCACMFSACGSNSKKEVVEDTIVSPQMKEIQKSADDVNAQADELNQKADSLLNNI